MYKLTIIFKDGRVFYKDGEKKKLDEDIEKLKIKMTEYPEKVSSYRLEEIK